MRKYIFFISFVFFQQSCIDLKVINTFATTSDATLQSVGENNYSFTSSYLRYHISQQFFDLSPDETRDNKFKLPVVRIDTSELEVVQEADKTIVLFVSSLQAYLQGLARLSAKDLVNYDFTKVGESIKGNASALGKTGASAADVDAALKISKVAADAIMGRYREKRLRAIIVDYNDEYQRTADALGKALELLANNIDADVEILKTRYRKFLADPSLPIIKKFEWRQEYSNELSELEKTRVIIKKQIKVVQKLKSAHGDIATGLANSKLDSKGIIELIKQHAGEIKSVHSSVKQLLK